MKELIQGKPLSKSELRKKNNKDCVQRNRFGFENSCEFFKLNGVTPWNISPPDSSRKSSVQQTTNGPEILVYGKAIQKVELFSKFKKSFHPMLILVVKRSNYIKFFMISHVYRFHTQVTNEDLVCLATRSKELVEVYSKFSIDNEVLSDDELDYCHHEDIHQNDDDDLIDGV
ncbi:hypothetical protein BLOT_011339 [Blomia tropicalis]|nr:hypothetical protein BLOT_011339 [Blomia tropicalis]